METQPFAFMLHGTADGKINSFFYGLERQKVIEVLEEVLKDYKRIVEESREVTTLEFKENGSGIYRD